MLRLGTSELSQCRGRGGREAEGDAGGGGGSGGGAHGPISGGWGPAGGRPGGNQEVSGNADCLSACVLD